MTATSADSISEHIAGVWDDDIVPALTRYIAIPNVSASYDADWDAHGFMEEAVQLVRGWIAARDLPGLTVDVQRIPSRSPLIVAEVPATRPDLAERTVLLYGHLDKQPEMTGWRDGLGPWTPVLEGNKLYGRGGADDGYAAFASLLSIEAAHRAGWDHARLLVLIEASEESGSPDLPAHLEALGARLGTPELVVCLDSAAADTEHLWVTTSLRGLVGGVLTVEVLEAGAHSGVASGIVPSSFRIIRELLDRVEDARTGEILIPELHAEIPADRRAEAETTAAALPEPAALEYPWAGATQPMVADPVEQLLARSWRPTLSYVGADGFPPNSRAGNVLRPSTSLGLSFRLPPTVDPHSARTAVTNALTANPPYGATVTFDANHVGPGWNAPSFAPWLREALDAASTAAFGNPASTLGEGGSIPFMGMLGEMFPDAQFVITGALLPDSNAHGPNEYLPVDVAKHVTECIARILAAHAAAGQGGSAA